MPETAANLMAPYGLQLSLERQCWLDARATPIIQSSTYPLGWAGGILPSVQR
jgi:hypothetical protein